MLKIPGPQRGKFCDGVSRRDFLRVGGLALGGLSLPQILRAEAASGVRRSPKAIIMIYLAGAPPHQDIFDLKMDAPVEFRGPFRPIRTKVPGIQISEHMPRCAEIMDRLVPIRSLYGSLTGDHDSHICYTGRSAQGAPKPPGGWPSLGAVMSKIYGSSSRELPLFVGLAPNAGHPPYGSPGLPGFLGASHAAFRPNGAGMSDLTLNSISTERLSERRALLTAFDHFRRDVDASGVMEGLDTFTQQAFGVLTSSRLAEALDLSKEDPKTRERYGRGVKENYGDGAPRNLEHFLLARRLVEAGARCVTLNFGRWDFHSNNHSELLTHLPLFDQGFSALVEDLHARGLDKDVAVVAWGEFGRTPQINKDAGRDHWPRVGCGVVAGGGFRTGQVIGSTDRLGGEPVDRPVHFGEVFATLYHWLGIDLATTTLPDLAGRPHNPRGWLVTHERTPRIMKTIVCLLLPLFLVASASAEHAVALRVEGTGTPQLTLRGKNARQQLLVTAEIENAAQRDYTRKASYRAEPAGIVAIDAKGLVSPLADGVAKIVAETDGVSGSVDVKVESFATDPAVNFANQVVPIFTKASCNSGGCHGKASGQNGFRLSLLGFEPTEDFEHIVKEARGRRVFPAAPDNSLLLLKATGIVPHGGGKRLEKDSDDYRLLVRWIAQGMPYGNEQDPKLARVEVLPKQRTMPLGGEQQIIVLAHYTDGTILDATRSALYEPNDKSMAKAEEDGRITLFDQPGDVGVMVRYQGQVAVFRATAPLGQSVEHLPATRNYVDELVFAKLKALGMPPSDPCDDATFFRRVTIDIAGRLPTTEETKKFAADADPAKRDKWIETLLASPEYADYFANKWSALLRNKRVEAKDTRGNFAFHDWIRESLLANKPYDQFVREIVAASGDVLENPPVAWYRQVREPQQQLEDTAQLFLGTRLQCAQCHHHPFEKWSQHDYYSFAAFFSQVGRKGSDVLFPKRGTATATDKKSRQAVKPAGLGTGQMDIAPEQDPRLALADWMAKPENPFFARSLVNRYWKHFFNRGLVEPEDDLRETNPPCNPELLEALAHHFVASGFDLKALIRDMVKSQTYQLSAVPNDFNKSDRQNFSRYFAKRLTAEVLFDSINQLTGAHSNFAGLPAGTHAVALPDNSYNSSSYFLTVFGRPDSSSACECERTQEASLAQSLHLLNAKEIQEKLAANDGRAARLSEDKQRTDDDQLRELYSAAYSREPQSAEVDFCKKYIESKITKEADAAKKPVARRQAYEDLVWALISSKEFLFNH